MVSGSVSGVPLLTLQLSRCSECQIQVLCHGGQPALCHIILGTGHWISILHIYTTYLHNVSTLHYTEYLHCIYITYLLWGIVNALTSHQFYIWQVTRVGAVCGREGQRGTCQPVTRKYRWQGGGGGGGVSYVVLLDKQRRIHMPLLW